MKKVEKQYDVVVCGGGLAGVCAALASARHGAGTCLVQDRPVLGGNASSEIKVTIHGAAGHHNYCRETGIIGEILNEQSRVNHVEHIENGSAHSMMDMVIYDKVMREPNLELFLNTTVRDVLLSDQTWGLDNLASWPVANREKGYYHRPACHDGLLILGIKATIANAETELILHGKHFIDCTGDGVLGHWSGCEWRWGSESTAETGEIHAPAESSTDTMGNSIHIRCIDTGRPVPFKAPDWAMVYEDAAFFYEQGRAPHEPKGGYWWLEIGVPFNTIHDNEQIRHELTRHALGVWDWMKNRDPKMIDRCRNYALDFIGQVPGKRESRRIIGRHFLNENELQRVEKFEDEVAYGGWFVDLHTPGGLLASTSEPASAHGYNPKIKEVALKNIGPYGIPLRSLQSRDVPNLMMAGRNISATHAALGTVRVMATCALMGQAAGTTAALAVQEGTERDRVSFGKVQQALLRDGCFLPHHAHSDVQDLARTAKATASSSWIFGGVSPWEEALDSAFHTILNRSREGFYPLSDGPCLWMQLGSGRLNRLGLWFKNDLPERQTVSIRLKKAVSVWDYKVDSSEALRGETLELPAGHDGLVWWETGLQKLEAGCYRLELSGSEGCSCRMSQNQAPGLSMGMMSGSGRYRWEKKQGFGALAFVCDPPQDIYNPEQVLSGITRPRNGTNLWISNPSAILPQYVDLEWPNEVEIGEVHLTFPFQWSVEVRFESPFYVAPMVASRYSLQIPQGRRWQTIQLETDNVEARRVHRLDRKFRTRKLRLMIEAVHRASSAGLVEIRCYA